MIDVVKYSGLAFFLIAFVGVWVEPFIQKNHAEKYSVIIRVIGVLGFILMGIGIWSMAS